MPYIFETVVSDWNQLTDKFDSAVLELDVEDNVFMKNLRKRNLFLKRRMLFPRLRPFSRGCWMKPLTGDLTKGEAIDYDF